VPATLKFRSAGLIRRGDKVLLHRGAEDDFWTLPGGTVEPGERSDEALSREIEEEIRISDAHAVRLLWMVENRFTYLGRRVHEIGFYWLLDVPERSWAEQSWPDHGGEFEMSAVYHLPMGAIERSRDDRYQAWVPAAWTCGVAGGADLPASRRVTRR
jgi:ADP-ribose pyrophosphatase YjhB (NUDIX family)